MKGHSLFAQKRYREAIREFEKVLETDPDHSESIKYINRAKKALK
jgi:tetratricopeptide (TPR) repeat protein